MTARSVLVIGKGLGERLRSDLDPRGYQVLAAEQIPDAEGLLDAAEADVLLFRAGEFEDPFLGLQMLMRIAPKAVVLIAVSESDEALAEELLEDGATDTVSDPPQAGELLLAFDAAIQHKARQPRKAKSPTFQPEPNRVQNPDRSRLLELEKVASELEEERDKALKRSQEVIEQLDTSAMRVRELEGLVEILKGRQSEGREEVSEIQEELEALRRERGHLEGQLEEAVAKLQQAEAEEQAQSDSLGQELTDTRRKARKLRETLTKKLEDTEAHLRNTQEACAIAESRAAEAWSEVDIKKLECVSLTKRLSVLEARNKELQDRELALLSQVERLKEMQGELKEKASSLSVKLRAQEAEARTEKQALRIEIQAARSERGSVHKDLSQALARAKEDHLRDQSFLRDQLEIAEEKLKELTTEREKNQQTLETLRNRLDEVEFEFQEKVRTIHSLEDQVRELTVEREAAIRKDRSLRNELLDLKSKLNTLTGVSQELEQLKAEVEDDSQARQEFLSRQYEVKSQLEELEEQLRDSRFHCLQAKAELAEAQAELELNRTSNFELTQDLQVSQARLQALELEFDELLERSEGRSISDIQEELTALLGQAETYRHRVGQLAGELQSAHTRAEEAAARAVRIEAGLRAAETQRAEATERAVKAGFELEQIRLSAEEDRRNVGRLVRFQEELIENLSSALIMIDPRGTVTLANHAATELLSAHKEELVGKPYREIPALRELSAEIRRGLTGRSLKGARARLPSGADTVSVEFKVTRLDVGGSRRCVLSLLPLFETSESDFAP